MRLVLASSSRPGEAAIDAIEDILANPLALRGLGPQDIEQIILAAERVGWQVGTLQRGSRVGRGLVVREMHTNGEPTGRMIQWHPGGGHHGTGPYWKVCSPERGTIRVPAADWQRGE
jgi:hypothetical protein